MDRLELLDELDRLLPPVDKPEGPDLSFHPSGCDACDMLRTELAIWPGRKLPMEALFWLHDDMSSLSAAGWRWALPSYLRLVLESPPDEINLLLGFLILNLNPSPPTARTPAPASARWMRSSSGCCCASCSGAASSRGCWPGAKTSTRPAASSTTCAAGAEPQPGKPCRARAACTTRAAGTRNCTSRYSAKSAA